MNRQYYSLFFVMGACLLLSLMYCPPFDLLLDDKEIFKYAGMAILRGEVPYRDFFDHKPPMIFFINAAGLIFGPWGLWMINTLLAAGTTLLFFNLCRKYRLPFPWLLPLLFNLMIRDYLISLGSNLTREYTSFFIILFFCVLLGDGRYRLFLLGFLTALIFFTQQEQVLPLVPLLIYTLANGPCPFWQRLFRTALGSLLLTLPILIYFAANHSLSYFLQATFQFNLSVYTTQHKTFTDHFRSTKYILDWGNFELPFMIALVLGTAALFLKNGRKGLLMATLMALILTMSPEFMGGRANEWNNPGYFIAYFLPLSAGVCMVLFAVFGFTEDRVLAGRKAQFPFIFLLCLSLSYTALQHSTHLRKNAEDLIMRVPELSYLRQQSPRDYQVYVFFDNQYIFFYNELRILAPSRWIYQHFWAHYDSWDTSHYLLSMIGQDLLRHRTNFVIMDTATLVQFRVPANRDWWLAFMQTYYEPVDVPGSTKQILWQLKKNTTSN
jgi:hypothetical protein